MPPKNWEGSSKFLGGHKVFHRTAQTAFVRVVTPSYPDLFEELFVAGNNITCSKVKECLVFPIQLTDEESRVKGYFEDYLTTASSEKMKDILIFATGAPCVPDFGLGKICIEFTDDSSISSSSCLKKITFPREFPGIETFMASINAVCDNAGRAFTSI